MANAGLAINEAVDLEFRPCKDSHGRLPRPPALQGGPNVSRVGNTSDRITNNKTGMGGDAPTSLVHVHHSSSSNIVDLAFADAEDQQQHAAVTAAAVSGARGRRKIPVLQGLNAAKRKIAPCFHLSRWPLLVLFCLHALFVGPHYLNWAPLRQCLLYWGVYEWLCDPTEQPQQQKEKTETEVAAPFYPSSADNSLLAFDLAVSPNVAYDSSLLFPGTTTTAAHAPPSSNLVASPKSSDEPQIHPGVTHHAVCKAQEIAIARLFGIATASDFGISFVGGLLLDAWGPKAASTIGTLSMLIGWLLVAFSSSSISLYILGFTFYGLGVDAAFYGVISLPLLFPEHEGLVMTILMSFRCLAWGTPIVLERLAAPETLGLSAHAVLLGVQCSTHIAGVLIAVLFIPMKPFQRPATQGSAVGPLQHQSSGLKDIYATDQRTTTAVGATTVPLGQEGSAAIAAAAAEEAQAEAAVTAAAAAAGTAVLPQTLRAPIAEEQIGDEDDVEREDDQNYHLDNTTEGLKETEGGESLQGFTYRSLRTMSSLSAVGGGTVVPPSPPGEDRKGSSSGGEVDHHHQRQSESQQYPHQEQQAAIFIHPFPEGGPSPLSSPSKRRRRQGRGTTIPRFLRACFHRIQESYHQSRAFVFDHMLSGAFLPIVPYFALSLLRGVYFGESSEYIVPQAMRALHILLGLVFVYPPILGFIADRCGVGLCLFLVNTLGALLMGLSLLQYYIENTALAYLICLCYSAYAPLMSGQVYLYMIQAFPPEHLGKLLGLAMTVGGFFSLIATPLFEVSVHRNVNFVIVLSVLLFCSFLAYGLLFWAVRANNKRNKTTIQLSPTT